jgi:type II secretory pathway pseudopilin PulG
MRKIVKPARSVSAARRSGRGYALVSLVVAMTITLIFLAAAAPAIKHESQREREEEMFWRGQQIADAIDKYRQLHNNQLPVKLDDLANTYEINGKRIRFLRPSALRDPMTRSGEWRPVFPGDPLIGELAFAYTATTKQPPPPGTLFAILAAVQGGTIVGGGLSTSPGAGTGPGAASSFFSNPGLSTSGSDSDSGPIVGVVSRSTERLIRNYYGIETYDHSLFISGARVPGQTIFYAVGGGGNSQDSVAPGPDNKCPPFYQRCRDGRCHRPICPVDRPPSN